MLLETQLKKNLVCVIALSVTLATIFGVFLESAEAAQLKAKIYLTQESIPRNLPEKELVAFANKHQAKSIAETNESEIKQRRWIATLIIAFNAPPGELEYEMAIYEIQNGIRILAESQSVLLSDRVQKTYVQRINLKRPVYKPNRDMELVLRIRQQEVGRLRFRVVGGDTVKPSTSASPEKARQKEPDL
jgi:hypothetical protein